MNCEFRISNYQLPHIHNCEFEIVKYEFRIHTCKLFYVMFYTILKLFSHIKKKCFE